uniref:Immunoglobulin subtype domain-containing protein n=1 Tax=Maylandia zebra TaxID=106582 RepID=A0A3P9DCH0_9CICH
GRPGIVVTFLTFLSVIWSSFKVVDSKCSVALTEGADFFWRFNIIHIVAKSNYLNSVVFGTYKGRAKIFVQNNSLLLKNVQHSDSGDYIAIVSGEQNQRVAEYKVITSCNSLCACCCSSDPVSPVNLTVDSVDSSSNSYFIICNHSNQVSWKHKTEKITSYCKTLSGKNKRQSHKG